MFVPPEQKLVERKMALEEALQAATRKVMLETGVGKLREIVGRRTKAF